MLDVLIFDLDGTLVDTLPDIANSVNYAFTSHDLPPKPSQEIRFAIGLGIENLIFTCLKETKGNWKAEKNEILNTFRSHYLEHCTDSSVLYPGVPELLEKYKHLKMAVLTNKADIYTRKILDSLKIGSCFSQIISGDTTPEKKPGTAGILKILENQGAAAGNSIMIGDSAPDVITARKVKMDCIGIQGGIGHPGELQQSAPEYLVDSFLEVEVILDKLNSIKKTA